MGLAGVPAWGRAFVQGGQGSSSSLDRWHPCLGTNCIHVDTSHSCDLVALKPSCPPGTVHLQGLFGHSWGRDVGPLPLFLGRNGPWGLANVTVAPSPTMASTP